jgi:hypothetical protein
MQQSVIRAMTPVAESGSEDETSEVTAPSKLAGEIVTQSQDGAVSTHDAASLNPRASISASIHSQAIRESTSAEVIAKARNWEVLDAYRIFYLFNV